MRFLILLITFNLFPCVSHLSILGQRVFTLGEAENFNSLLYDSDVMSIEEMGTGAFSAQLVTFKNGVQSVFKGRGEHPLNYYPSEIAAYRLAQSIGFNFVLPTRYGRVRNRYGFLQLYISNTQFYNSSAPEYRDLMNNFLNLDNEELEYIFEYFDDPRRIQWFRMRREAIRGFVNG